MIVRFSSSNFKFSNAGGWTLPLFHYTIKQEMFMFLVKQSPLGVYIYILFLQRAQIVCIATEIYTTSYNGTTSTIALCHENTIFFVMQQ